eukprot:gene7245-5093_t
MSSASIPNVFIGFVLNALEHPPFMYVSKLAACCAMLFLDRSDEELLRELCTKWATCFIKDRERMRQYASASSQQQSGTSRCVEKKGASTPHRWRTDSTDRDEVVKHFLIVLNSLAFMYFSFNWNKTEYIIQINREYAYYIRDHVLPLCVELGAEEGSDEPMGESTILSPVQEVRTVVPFFSPTVVNRDFRSAGSSLRNSIAEGGSVPIPRPSSNSDSVSNLERSPATSAPPRAHASRRLQRRLQARAQSHITVLHLSNYEAFMEGNTTGRLIVFHGVYCDKSNALRKVLDAFIDRSPLTPMPKVGVVYTMSEPQLAALYNISWFPTIIYHPPRSMEEVESKRLYAESPRSVDLEPHLSVSSLDKPIDLSVYASSSPIHGFKDEIKFLLGKNAEVMPSSEPGEFPCTAEDALTYPRLPQLGSSTAAFHSLEERHGTCRVFPICGAPTVHVLIAWIRSGGTYVPDAGKECHSMLETTDELKASLHAAVMLLKRIEKPPIPSVLSPDPELAAVDAPVFVFLGGGMAAGKTTALTALSRSDWWKGKETNAVVVCADEFKPPNFDPRSPDAHQNSTRAAEQLLIQAINQRRNIVLDGTMMWAPFIVEVVNVLRCAHLSIFKPGIGYDPDSGKEQYFEYARKRAVPQHHPYRIICLGITVEPDIAVPRGIMRQFSTGRGVPVKDQLKSFKLFSENFPLYVTLMDKVILLNNNIFVDLRKGELPPEMARKDDVDQSLLILDPEAYALALKIQPSSATPDVMWNGVRAPSPDRRFYAIVVPSSLTLTTQRTANAYRTKPGATLVLEWDLSPSPSEKQPLTGPATVPQPVLRCCLVYFLVFVFYFSTSLSFGCLFVFRDIIIIIIVIIIIVFDEKYNMSESPFDVANRDYSSLEAHSCGDDEQASMTGPGLASQQSPDTQGEIGADSPFFNPVATAVTWQLDLNERNLHSFKSTVQSGNVPLRTDFVDSRDYAAHTRAAAPHHSVAGQTEYSLCSQGMPTEHQANSNSFGPAALYEAKYDRFEKSHGSAPTLLSENEASLGNTNNPLNVTNLQHHVQILSSGKPVTLRPENICVSCEGKSPQPGMNYTNSLLVEPPSDSSLHEGSRGYFGYSTLFPETDQWSTQSVGEIGFSDFISDRTPFRSAQSSLRASRTP